MLEMKPWATVGAEQLKQLSRSGSMTSSTSLAATAAPTTMTTATSTGAMPSEHEISQSVAGRKDHFERKDGEADGSGQRFDVEMTQLPNNGLHGGDDGGGETCQNCGNGLDGRTGMYCKHCGRRRHFQDRRPTSRDGRGRHPSPAVSHGCSGASSNFHAERPSAL